MRERRQGTDATDVDETAAKVFIDEEEIFVKARSEMDNLLFSMRDINTGNHYRLLINI